MSWRSLRRSFSLFRSDRRSWQQFARAWRYRIDKNALRFTKQVLKTPAEKPRDESRNLVLFAHFDPSNGVDPYVVHYVRALRDLGSEIIFVSGSPDLSPESAKTLEPYCAAIFTQSTLGMDFGSWNLGWQQMQRAGWDVGKFDRVILANDSVYAPLYPLREMFEAFTGADVYSATESLEIEPHLQSYFLVFAVNPRTREFLNAFWNRFQYEVVKQNLIENYEIGLSRSARQRGLRLLPYISHAAVQEALEAEPGHQFREQSLGKNVNATLYLWDILISRLRCPFLKTDVPKNNRYGSELVRDLDRFLHANTAYPTELIEAHLNGLRNLSR